MNTHNAICSVIVLLVACLTAFAEDPLSVVPENSVSNPRQPQAAVDEVGTIYVAFGADDAIYCCKSTDVGKTFGDPVKIGAVSKLALGMRRGPRIVASSDAVVIAAIGHDGGNLLSWRSTDGGKSWQDPVQVNDSPKDAREGLHAMAMSPTGEIYCVWLDLRNKETQLFGAVSVDSGKTWSENRQIYRSPGGNICECCHPAVTFDFEGNLYVMWRNSLNGCRDIYSTISRDAGKTFAAGSKLGTGNWKLNACPMDGGYLAVVAPDKVTTVWRRDRQIFRTDTGRRGEQLLGTGEQPWAAATTDGAYLVWLSRRNGDLWLATPGKREPRKLSSNASDPVIAGSVTGKGPVVAVWETGKNQQISIMAMVVSE